MPLSIRVYNIAGIVDKARYEVSNAQVFLSISEYNVRPKNSANEVSVPCSASNLSSNGVRASRLKKAWKNPAWMRGNVFVLYTSGSRISWRLFLYDVRNTNWYLVRSLSVSKPPIV